MQNLQLQLLPNIPGMASSKENAFSGKPDIKTLAGFGFQSSGFASILQGLQNTHNSKTVFNGAALTILHNGGALQSPAKSIAAKLSAAIEKFKNTDADPSQVAGYFLQSLTNDEKIYLNQLFSKNAGNINSLNKLMSLLQDTNKLHSDEDKTISSVINLLTQALENKEDTPAPSNPAHTQIADKLNTLLETVQNSPPEKRAAAINDFLKSLTDEQRAYLNQQLSKNIQNGAAEKVSIESLLNTPRQIAQKQDSQNNLISNITEKPLKTAAPLTNNSLNSIKELFLKTDKESNSAESRIPSEKNQSISQTFETQQGKTAKGNPVNPYSMLYNIIQQKTNPSYNQSPYTAASVNPLLQYNPAYDGSFAETRNLIQTLFENSSSSKEGVSNIKQLFINSIYGEAGKKHNISNERHANLDSKATVKVLNAKTEAVGLNQTNSGKNHEKSFDSRHDLNDFKNFFNTSSVSSSNKTSSTAKTTSPVQAHWSSVLEQISGKIQNSARPGQQTINIQLDPPELGRLNINMTLKGNNLHAMIFADSPVTKQLIESNIAELRSSLESSGLDFGKVSVFVGQNNNPSLFGEKKTMVKNSSNQNSNGTGKDTNEITEIFNDREFILTRDTVDLFA